ncbi:MAG: SDR family NAD(P)-dependent oxidoreductase [Phycisphaerales bacterium JB052]
MGSKTILITGSTDGIGLATARSLISQGHTVLVHGRNPDKIASVEQSLRAIPGAGEVESFRADLSDLGEVRGLADAIEAREGSLDVLINNAGVFKVPKARTRSGLDMRFVVNTIAPYLLTKRLLKLFPSDGRVVNLSSAAQAPVSLNALSGKVTLGDSAVYAQSKLALTAWSRAMALDGDESSPMIVSVNPGSLLATNMVKQAYGMDGADIGIGADILMRAALSDEFRSANGQYYDNDTGRFTSPHPDAVNEQRANEIVQLIEQLLSEQGHAVTASA